jgi:hypothetical protein
VSSFGLIIFVNTALRDAGTFAFGKRKMALLKRDVIVRKINIDKIIRFDILFENYLDSIS